jgi:CrcB protein
LQQIIIAGLGGFIGSACRFWLASVSYRLLGQDFPYGTMIVNILGCFLIGLLMSIFEERFLVSPNLRIFLTIGILGGFTTFSSFSFESLSLLREGNYFSGMSNILITLIGCLSATWIGTIFGKIL